MADTVIKVVQNIPSRIIVREPPPATVVTSNVGPPGSATVVDTFFRLKYTDVKTANYQGKVGETVLCDVSGGSFTVTAPTSPSVDEIFAIKVETSAPLSDGELKMLQRTV